MLAAQHHEITNDSAADADLDVPDAELVQLALAKRSWAEAELYRRHARAVAGIATRLLRDSAEAQDVVQDTFLTAFTRLASLEDPAAFRGWLCRIAVRHVSRRVRRGNWRRLLLLEDPYARLESLASAEATQSVRAELSRIDTALQGTRADHRIAWVLRHVEGYSLPETAEACGCSLATVKRRLAIAERLVQRKLGGADVD